MILIEGKTEQEEDIDSSVKSGLSVRGPSYERAIQTE